MAQLPGIEVNTLSALCAYAHKVEDSANCGVKAFGLWAAINADELGILNERSRTVSLSAKDVLFRQGEDADYVFIVTSGSVRVYRSLPDGRRQIIGFALPGDFLGVSMRNQNTFSADALALMTARRFSRKSFSSLLDDQRHMLKLLHDVTSHDLSLAQEQLVIMGCHSAFKRVAAFLVGLRDRWSVISGTTLHIPLPMTRQDIADFLGMSMETVSRELSRLAREKAILIVPDGVRLLDLKRLQMLARH